jgi:hypothetical protein
MNELFGEIVLHINESRMITPQQDRFRFAMYREYSDFRGTHISGQTIYLAGNRVMLDFWKDIFRLSRKNTIVWEIADLPFRHHPVVNFVAGNFYKLFFLAIRPSVVVTAPKFLDSIPGRKSHFVAENIPTAEVARLLAQLPLTPFPSAGPVTIGFAGILRYFGPLKNLYRFATEHSGKVRIKLWGGPEERWYGFCRELGIPPEGNESISYHGPYSGETALMEIYREVDLVWAVYEAQSQNVRLALPNRLYEAILAGKFIAVARDTALAQVVEDNRIGFSLPTRNESYSEFAGALLAGIDGLSGNGFSHGKRQELLAKAEGEKEAFLDFLRTGLHR